jgi:hypothetical protein
VRTGPVSGRISENICCRYCGVTAGSSSLTIDHVVPSSKGGDFSWTNCVTACTKCNQVKGSKSLSQIGWIPLRTPKVSPQPHFQFCIHPRYLGYCFLESQVPGDVHVGVGDCSRFWLLSDDRLDLESLCPLGQQFISILAQGWEAGQQQTSVCWMLHLERTPQKGGTCSLSAACLTLGPTPLSHLL